MSNMSDTKFNGTVKWFNTEKGFGFIKPNLGDTDVFVHFSQVKNDGKSKVTLKDGQKVEYSIGQNKQGKQAINVVAV